MLRQKRIYQRYLASEVLSAVLLVLFAFVSLFTFFEFVDEIRLIGRQDYALGHAAMVVLLAVPGLVYELIPVACLIGALYALAALARHSELTVLRASGVSTGQLLATLFRVAGVMALVTFLVGETLVPVTDRVAQEVKAGALNKVFAQQGFLTGIWVKDGREFVNIRSVDVTGNLTGIRVYRFAEDNSLQVVMDAESAHFNPGRGWVMRDVRRTELGEESARVSSRDEDVWTSAVTPDLLSVMMVAPERMSLISLVRYYRHLTDNRQDTERFEIAIWKKLLYPLATLVMVALALPFGYAHDRVGGVSLKIFLGVMLGITFYALNGLFSNLGVIHAWPPLASAVAPSAFFLLAAIVMLWWVERR